MRWYNSQTKPHVIQTSRPVILSTRQTFSVSQHAKLFLPKHVVCDLKWTVLLCETPHKMFWFWNKTWSQWRALPERFDNYAHHRETTNVRSMFLAFNVLLESKMNISLCTDLIFTDHLFICLVNCRTIYWLYVCTSGSSHLTAIDTH